MSKITRFVLIAGLALGLAYCTSSAPPVDEQVPEAEPDRAQPNEQTPTDSRPATAEVDQVAIPTGEVRVRAEQAAQADFGV